MVAWGTKQCLAMAALRRMAIPQDNRHLLVEAGILAMLARAGRSSEVEIQREVTGTLPPLPPVPQHSPPAMEFVGATLIYESETTTLSNTLVRVAPPGEPALAST